MSPDPESARFGLLEHWIETTSKVVSILMGWVATSQSAHAAQYTPPAIRRQELGMLLLSVLRPGGDGRRRLPTLAAMTQLVHFAARCGTLSPCFRVTTSVVLSWN
jgi:hypothetical protein